MRTPWGSGRRTVASIAATAMVSAGLMTITASTAGAAETYWVPPTGNLTVHGRGFGHGRGMSQYGAQGRAIAGQTAAQILGFYYPGTAVASQAGWMRIHLTGDTTSNLWVPATSGLKVRDLGDNAVWTLPPFTSISYWSIEPYGENQTRIRYYSKTAGAWFWWRAPDGRTVFKGMSQYEGPAVIPLILNSTTRVYYRNILRAANRPGAVLDTLNVLPLDNYVRGVVPKEAITSWRPAALQAQAVAARTYSVAKRAAAVGDFDLCDTTACQVYGGYSAEVPSTTAAVTATAGQIRTYGGNPILAEFSSSNGGYTAPGPLPYQVGKQDTYDAYPGNGNPNSAWTVSVSRATAEARFGVGTLKYLTVTQRNSLGTWGGRVLGVEAGGTSGKKTFTGDQVRTLLGLKSAWFRFEQSQIIQRWLAIGGNASPVGAVAGYEWACRGGSFQNFAAGSIYRGSAGTWEVYGGFITRYRQLGGPNHALGLPVAARSNGLVAGSLAQRFQTGRMVYHASVGVREVFGPIQTAYAGVGQEGGRLGLPTSYQTAWSGGNLQVFQHGRITWTRTTNTTTITYT